jgi:prepilin-type N-terminal cleavage/methylation domain-containing protein/prepilin-type processing-associated H-X9-DG protein
MKRQLQKSGFTLVELLVVVTIIGILVALLLPAVQAAREAARKMQCTNNLKQLALACLGHENLNGRFPTNGWGYGWTGDADRGTNWRQPGGWIYNTLPFIDQPQLHDLGMGMGPWNDTNRKLAHGQRLVTPITGLICPTRRPAIVYPGSGNYANGTASSSIVIKTDYAINGGDTYTQSVWSPSWGDSATGPADPSQVENPPGQLASNGKGTFTAVASVATGISFCGSMITMAEVTDGASNTYLLGEKYVWPDAYFNGGDWGDNESALMGDNQDIERWTYMGRFGGILYPLQDTPGLYVWEGIFGSAHASGFNMAFCDGAVQQMNYQIDILVHKYLGNRNDGKPVDPKQL